jgi:hypothetical protein
MSFPGDRVRSAPALGRHKERSLSTDWYTKLVLTVLAASAAFLAAQHLDQDAGDKDGPFRLQAVPMARILLRIDTETGRTWTTKINKPEVWQEIAESPIDKAVEEEAAAAEPEAPAARIERKKPEAPAAGIEGKAPEAPPAEDS